MQKVNLNRKVFDRDSFEKTVNTKFSELTVEGDPLDSLNIDDFFELYDKLFYQIPKNGEENSHEFLIRKSTEYVNQEINDRLIEALQEEISQLREQLLEANNRSIINSISSYNKSI